MGTLWTLERCCHDNKLDLLTVKLEVIGYHLLPYIAKHLRGKTFAVHEKHLLLEKIHGLAVSVIFSSE